ncbi:adenylate kinase [Dactylosporangium sp. NPDC051485]|uniref:adenylate kinase n=1 Tax=Dactylosporangium sp. NPDC051485 TaxID=3154846 RepID=UPI00341ACA5D
MRVLMIAPPGAGKGTQGAVVAEHFGLDRITIGDLLRRNVAEDTELGRRVQPTLARGELVPDDIVLELTRQGLAAAKAAGRGYVLDGVPRTMAQALAAYRIGLRLRMTADVALHLAADDDELLRRLLNRAGTEHRADDNEPVIRQRLRFYREVTEPVLQFYARRRILLTVDAQRPLEAVSADVIAALRERAAGLAPR